MLSQTEYECVPAYRCLPVMLIVQKKTDFKKEEEHTDLVFHMHSEPHIARVDEITHTFSLLITSCVLICVTGIPSQRRVPL